MSLERFLRLFGRNGRRKRPSVRPTRRRPILSLEALEKRELMANDTPRIINIIVDGQAGDNISVNIADPTLQIEFSEAMQAAGAVDESNYLLFSSDGAPVTIDTATLDGTGTVVTLTYNGGNDLFADTYTLFVRGDQLLDVDDGRALAQAGQLAVANGGRNNVAVVNMPGDGTLGTVSNYVPTPVGATQPVKVALEDMDGDGLDDLLVLNQGSSTVAIYGQRPDGLFDTTPSFILDAAAGSSGPQSFAIADFNNDGKLDLAVAHNTSSTVDVYLNARGTLPEFTFTAPVTLSNSLVSPTAIVAADLDKDTFVDLVVANGAASSSNHHVVIYKGDGTGGFTFNQTIVVGEDTTPSGVRGLTGLAVGLLDGDAQDRLDIAVVGSTGAGLAWLANNSTVGTIAFAAPVNPYGATGPALRSVAIGVVRDTTNTQGDIVVTKTGTGTDTIQVHVNNGTGTFAAPINLAGGETPRGLELADADGDGNLDILVTNEINQGTLRLFQNTSSGATTSFAEFAGSPYDVDSAVNSLPSGLAVGDVNDDGILDVVTANAGAHNVSVFQGDGGGALRRSLNISVTPTTTRDVAVADFNRDGILDLVVINNNGSTASSRITVMLGLAGGGYGTPVDYNPKFSGSTNFRDFVSVAVGDINNDGRPDIIIAGRQDSEVGFLRNDITTVGGALTGASFFAIQEVQTGDLPRDVTVADVDGDGNLDLLVAHDRSGGFGNSQRRGVSVHLGNGNFTFQNRDEFASGTFASAVAVGDFNQDGDLDFVVAEDFAPGRIKLRLGNGNGGFTDGGTFGTGVTNPTGIAVADVNRDGFLDVIVSSPSTSLTAGGIAVLINQLGSGFGPAIRTDVLPGTGLASVAVANVNQDAFIDIVVGTLPGTGGATDDNVYTLLGNGDGTFHSLTPYLAGGAGTPALPPSYVAVVSDPFLRAGSFSSGGTTLKAELVHNWNFEAFDLTGEQGNLLGWQTFKLPDNPGGSHGGWNIWTDDDSPLSGEDVIDPRNRYGAMLDQYDLMPIQGGFGGPGPNPNSDDSYEGSHALYQDVFIPPGAFDVTLSLRLYINSDSAFSDTTVNPLLDYRTSADNQQVRVDIMDPNGSVLGVNAGTGVLQTIFITSPGQQQVQNMLLSGIDLSAFAGQTIRLRIAATNNRGKLIVGVDDVSVLATFTDNTAPTLSGLGLRNPGVLVSNVPTTTDPTLTGRVDDNGSPSNIAFIEFDPYGTGFGGADDIKVTTWDANGNFSLTLPNLPFGRFTVGVRVVDKAGNQFTRTFVFNHLGDSNTHWGAVGPNGIDVSGHGVDYNEVTGRITSIAVDAHDATGSTYYVGSANGGVWKTTDGGASWTPLMDSVKDAAGNPVQVPIGGLSISSYQPRATGTAAANLVTAYGKSAANVSVQADINLTARNGTQEAAVLARYMGSGDNTYYKAAVVNTNGVFKAQISKSVNGVVTLLGTANLTTGTGTLRFEVVGSSLKLFFGPGATPRLSLTDTSLTGSGGVGIRGTANVSFSNFLARTAGVATPTTLLQDDFTGFDGKRLGTTWAHRIGTFIGNTRVLYAATGVGDLNFESRPGVGVLKSLDGGKTWTLIGNSATALKDARVVKLVIDNNTPDIVYVATAEDGNSSSGGVYRSTDGGLTWVNVLNPAKMFLPNSTTTLGAGTQLASVTDLIIDPFNSNRLLVGLGNIGLVPGSSTAGVWRSVNKGESWDSIVGGDDPTIPNNGLPSGTGVGRVTLGMGNGRVGDERYVYVLMGTPPGNNTPPSIDQGSLLGLFRTTDNLLNFTKVMLRQDVGSPADHNFVDIELMGVEASSVGAVLVDPNNPNVVYVGGSRRYAAGQFSHSLIRVDTGNMQDTTYLNGSINDGDDRSKAARAAFLGNDYNPDPNVTDAYTGEGVYWYDIEQDASGDSGQARLLPAAIHALALDAQGRLLIGTEGGIWRGVSHGFGYDFTSGGDGIINGSFRTPGMTLTSLNGNLQIANLTSVAVDPAVRDLLYITTVGSGAATSSGVLDWFSSGLTGPEIPGATPGSFTNLLIPTAGSIEVATPIPGAPADSPTVLYRVWQYLDQAALRPETSGDNGVTFQSISSAGIPVSGNVAGRFPGFVINPTKVFDSGQWQDELLFGTNRVFLTRTAGNAWDPISPVLSTQGGVITAMSFAPSLSGVYYVGMNTGELFVTLNTGADGWPLRTAGLPTGRPVNGIAVDPDNHLRAYVMFGGTGLNGYVYRTTNGGVSWTKVSTGLPNVPAYSMVIDKRPALLSPQGKLYLATERGVYYSTDDGASWKALGQGMPTVPVVDLYFNADLEVLAAATAGRSAFTISTAAISPIPDQVINEDTSTLNIPFSINDNGMPSSSYSVVAVSSNQALIPNSNLVLGGSGSQRTIKATPNANASGVTTITIRVNDGTRVFVEQFKITVLDVNDLPTITDPPDLAITVPSGGTLNVTVGDIETPAGSLIVTATSSDQAVIPDSGLLVTGTGANRTLTITPAAGQVGTLILTLTVTDAHGGTDQSIVHIRVRDDATLPFSDDFNRPANNYVGAYWDKMFGNMAGASNQALVKTAVGISAVRGVTAGDVRLEADIVVGTGQSAGLIARYAGVGDKDMYYGAIEHEAGAFRARIYKNVGGTWTRLTNAIVSAGTGTGRLTLEVVDVNLKLFFDPAGAAPEVLLGGVTDTSLLSPGRVGVRGTLNTRFDNFNAELVATPTAALPFSDDFDGTNGDPLDGVWLQRAGSYTVQGNLAKAGAASANLAAVNGISAKDVRLSADIDLAAGQLAGLVARYTGGADSNMYFGAVLEQAGAFKARIYKNTGSGFVVLSEQTVSTGTGKLTFEVVGNSLKLLFDPAGGDPAQLVGRVIDTSITAAGKVGVRGRANVTFNDFSADKLPASPVTLPFDDDFGTGGTADQLGDAWESRAGNFTVTPGGLAQAGSASVNLAALVGVSQKDVRLSAIIQVGAGDLSGLVARYTGAGDKHMYFGAVLEQSGTYMARIYKNTGSGFVVLSEQTLSTGVFPSFVTSGSGELTFEVVGNSLKLFLDDFSGAGDRLVGSVIDTSITAAGRVGMRGRADVLFDDFHAEKLPNSPPTLPFADEFNVGGTADQLADGWESRAGDFTVSAGTAQASSAPVNLAALVGLSVQDVRLRALIDVGAGEMAGLVARYTGVGDSNMYFGAILEQSGSYFARIYRNTGSGFVILSNVNLSSLSTPFTGAGVLTFEVVGDSLKLFVDAGVGDELVGSVTDNSITGPGRIGIRSRADGVFENFEAE